MATGKTSGSRGKVKPREIILDFLRVMWRNIISRMIQNTLDKYFESHGPLGRAHGDDDLSINSIFFTVFQVKEKPEGVKEIRKPAGAVSMFGGLDPASVLKRQLSHPSNEDEISKNVKRNDKEVKNDGKKTLTEEKATAKTQVLRPKPCMFEACALLIYLCRKIGTYCVLISHNPMCWL